MVADTHGRPHPRALEHIARLEPRAILHAGDIGGIQVVDDLAKLARTIAVRGNVDGRAPELPDSADVTVEFGAKHVFKLLLTHIALYGPRLLPDAASLARRHDASLVVCGHSHVPFIGRDRGLTLFNPGSIGPRRFALPITFGVMQLSDSGWELRHVSAETGDTWTP